MKLIFAQYDKREATKVFNIIMGSKTIVGDTTQYGAEYKTNDGIVLTVVYFTDDACGYLSFTGEFIIAKNWILLDETVKF
jgi:hypothetical protein